MSCALDDVVRGDVLNLCRTHLELGLTMSSHHVSRGSHISERVAGMYLAALSSLADRERFRTARASLSKARLSAEPLPNPRRASDAAHPEAKFEPVDPPSGCRFRTRCQYAQPVFRNRPRLSRARADHCVACLFFADVEFLAGASNNHFS